MSMRWLVPMAAASSRRLRLLKPWATTKSTAAARSRSRGGAARACGAMADQCTMWYMYRLVQGVFCAMKTRFSAERVIDAPADVVYRCLADYTHHHRPGGFLPPAFSNQEVLSGGVGDGTVIRLNVS